MVQCVESIIFKERCRLNIKSLGVIMHKSDVVCVVGGSFKKINYISCGKTTQLNYRLLCLTPMLEFMLDLITNLRKTESWHEMRQCNG